MEIPELEALRDSGEWRVFTARWERHDGTHSEGARGTVLIVGTPVNPDTVVVLDAAGGRHRWNRRHMSAD
ncbi:hypothetical protein [Streptomyces tsukubensis]|uniref:hypothetical protein n=1 Tax=Streptomyces tsukubensis TaxID=83656 RepID=UPI003450D707